MLKLVLFLGLLLAAFFGAHFFLYSSLVRFVGITNAIARTTLLVVLLILAACFMASFFLLRWKQNPWTVNFYISAALWTGLSIHLTVACALSWATITITRLVGYPMHARSVALFFLGLALVYSAYGVWNAFHPRVKNLDVKIADLPQQWKDKRIVQLSDVHLGHVYGVGFLKRLVEKVNSNDPDLILITGDLFDGMSRSLDPFIEVLNELDAKEGVFFVLGNHETYIGLKRVLGVLQRTRIHVLRNEMVDLDGLQIIGVDYPGLRGPDEGFLGNHDPDRPTLLLFHTPTNIGLRGENDVDRHFSTYWVPDTSLALAKQIGVDLQLSGHTHAGQIFPFGLLTKLLYRGYDYGFHKDGNFSIYTTSGVGTWGPPMRNGVAPEIVVIALK